MTSVRSARLVTLAVLLCALDQAAASLPQVIPRPYDQRYGNRYATGDLSRYEALYGSPEFRGIDGDHGQPWPRMLEVTGKVETAPRYVYLRAKSVALVRREKDEPEAR